MVGRSRSRHRARSPDHVSTYGLTFERGTDYWSRRERGELAEVDEELEREMYALAIDRLTAAGFEHYEVSNFARPGHRSRHNQVYWSGDGYFAAGPGAARYVERHPRNQSPQHDDLPAARPGRRVASRRTRGARRRSPSPRTTWSSACDEWKASIAETSPAEPGMEVDELVASPAQEVRRPGAADRRRRANSPHARRPLRQRRNLAGDAVRREIEDVRLKTSELDRTTSLSHPASNIPTAALGNRRLNGGSSRGGSG